jgi:hypothetical protein
MKRFAAIIAIVFLAFSFCGFISHRSIHKAFQQGKSEAGHDSVRAVFFTPESFFTAYHLKSVHSSLPNMKKWDTDDLDARINTVCDIRWEFDDNKKAMDYHRTNLIRNSENGEEIKLDLTMKGAEDVHVYNEGEAGARMLNAVGLGGKFHQYYYLFVVKNIAVKVFVMSKSEVTAKEAAVFAGEAAKTVMAGSRTR